MARSRACKPISDRRLLTDRLKAGRFLHGATGKGLRAVASCDSDDTEARLAAAQHGISCFHGPNAVTREFCIRGRLPVSSLDFLPAPVRAVLRVVSVGSSGAQLVFFLPRPVIELKFLSLKPFV